MTRKTRNYYKKEAIILDLTCDYSLAIKDFMKSKNETSKIKADEIYSKLNKILKKNDARRIQIEILQKILLEG